MRHSPLPPLDAHGHSACSVVLRFSRDGRAGRWRLRMCSSGAHLVGVTNSCPRGSAWWMAWPAWCSASWRVVRCSAGCGSAMRGSAHRCRGQLSRATLPRSSSTWLSAAAFAIVSSDTTADASCFHEGLLRIALCSPNSCCWSRSSCVAAQGDHTSWNTTSSSSCCVICEEKLRQPGPNPVAVTVSMLYTRWRHANTVVHWWVARKKNKKGGGKAPNSKLPFNLDTIQDAIHIGT